MLIEVGRAREDDAAIWDTYVAYESETPQFYICETPLLSICVTYAWIYMCYIRVICVT